MVGGPQASTVDHHGSAPASCCPPYAKVPSGELISEDFLTKCLPDVAAATGAVAGFRVDESSLLVGRHSTTFRLLLDWSPSSTDTCKSAGDSAGAAGAGAATVVGQSQDGTDVQPGGGPVGSVFVKRMTCRELPPRSLIKWR